MDATTLRGNLARVQERINAAAARANRDPAEITIVGVTKLSTVETVRWAYDAGLRDFGENRVEQALPKAEELPDDIRWHCIGHVQRRKAAAVAKICHLLHSLDSLRLAQRLQRICAETGRDLPVLLEVNVSGEASKYGLTPADMEQTVTEIAASCPQLKMQGLMTMAPLVHDPEEARPHFHGLRELLDRLRETHPDQDWQHLSMGMTGDFEPAIEEGATIVRVGRAIFGPA
jgi:pyridoxal phosphate enzyme (YggS family)